jgi:hypothetical protein
MNAGGHFLNPYSYPPMLLPEPHPPMLLSDWSKARIEQRRGMGERGEELMLLHADSTVSHFVKESNIFQNQS